MNLRDTGSEIDLARRARQLFREHLAQLDETTRARLRAARLRAVDAGSEPRPFGWAPRQWLAAGAVGAFAAALVAVWTLVPGAAGVDRGSVDVANSSDLELLLGGEDFDVVQNLEFYAWLEEQKDAKPAAKSADSDQSG
jgi:hypothetical protein